MLTSAGVSWTLAWRGPCTWSRGQWTTGLLPSRAADLQCSVLESAGWCWTRSNVGSRPGALPRLYKHHQNQPKSPSRPKQTSKHVEADGRPGRECVGRHGEEDLLLVSYVQEHGPGNWRAVPANTGLMRCSKSCRLRWTNYLRPGIMRGNFSDQEEKTIIELHALLGNKWSAIASYLPERMGNDIKNYWNTHLKKKLAKAAGASESGASGSAKTKGDRAAAFANKGQWERRLQTDFHTARQAFQEALSMETAPPAIKPEPLPLEQLPAPDISPAMYACSIENIARLLECWMRPSASGKASAESRSSVSPVSGGGQGGSGSHSGWAQSGSHSGWAQALEGFTGTAKVEGAGGAGQGPSSSLPMLESWLFDDGMGHGDAGLICMPLADPGEFF